MVYRERYSFSRLDCYRQCPKKYEFRYIKKIRNEDNQWASIGTAVHQVAEDLVNASMASGLPLDRTDIPDLLRKAWVDSGGVGDNEDFSLALEWLRSWLDSESSLDIKNVIGTEVGFTLDFGTFDLIGKIDRVEKLSDGRILVSDYKTNRMLYEGYQLEKSLQATIYALAAHEMYQPEEVPLVAFIMVAHRSIRQYSRRTPSDLEAIRYFIEATVEVIRRTKVFRAKLGPYCFWCDHNGMCEKYKQAMSSDSETVRATVDPKEAAKILQRANAVYKAASKTKRAAESVIKSWVNKTGESLQVNGTSYDVINVERRIFSVKEVLSALAKSSPDTDILDIAEATCSIKKGMLEDFVETMPIPRSRSLVLEERLKAAAETVVSPRMSVK